MQKRQVRPEEFEWKSVSNSGHPNQCLDFFIMEVVMQSPDEDLWNGGR